MIKNILFDFGGVLFDLDFNKSFEAFEALGYTDIRNMFSQYHAGSLFKMLETGRIAPADFYKSMQAVAPAPATEEQIRNAFNAMLLGYRYKSLFYLAALKNDYNLYLLSNTNDIHYDYFIGLLQSETDYFSLDPFFTIPFYSQKIGYRKPDNAAFEFVLDTAGIKAAETLFIDDTYSNLPSAEALGFKTHLLLPSERVEELDYTAY
ncbi:MAG: HAD family phosphatase [Niabella sp.]